MTLRTFLGRLIWICLLPLVLVAAWLAADGVLGRMDKTDQQAGIVTKNTATSIDQLLIGRIGALEVMAQSPLMDEPARWPELYRQAQAFQQAFGAHVVFADNHMQMLFNTRTPFGTPLPALPRPAGFAAAPAALASGRPAVGDSFTGPIAGERLVAIAVPVLREGKPTRLLLATFTASVFTKRMSLIALPEGASISLLDGSGVLIAAHAPAPLAAGQNDMESRHYFASSARSRWSVRMDIPADIYRGPIYRAAAGFAAAVFGATFAGVLGGLFASRRLDRSLVSLTQVPATQAGKPDIEEIEAVRHRLFEAAEHRGRAELESRASEARFAATFEQAAVGIALVAPDGRWLRVNRRLCEIVGYSQDELLSLTFQDITHPDDLDADLDHVHRMLARTIDSYSMEKRYLRKDGSTVWILLTVALTWKPNGAPDYFISVVEDIQARKDAEADLRLWGEVFDKARLGLAIADVRTNCFLAVSPMFAAERGYTQAELIGKPTLSAYPPDLQAEVRERIAALDLSSHGVFETEHISRDGRRFPVLMDITVIKDEAGTPITRVAYALDISERRRAEVLLREQAASLRDLTERLMRAQEDERRALAQELHDEIGQQLTALKLNLQTLSGTVSGQAGAARIADCIEIAETAIEQVRDRALSLRPSMLDDLGLGAALDWYCRRQSERSGTMISLRVDAPTQMLPDPLPITLFRIVQEAVNNAIRYAQADHIEVTLRTPDHAIELVVQDDGRGFDPAALDPRRDESMGLAGMRQRMRWLGGEIDIASTPGSGTRIHAILPLKEFTS